MLCVPNQSSFFFFNQTNDYWISNIVFPFLGPTIGHLWSVFYLMMMMMMILENIPMDHDRCLALGFLESSIFSRNMSEVVSFDLQRCESGMPIVTLIILRTTSKNMASNKFWIREPF